MLCFNGQDEQKLQLLRQAIKRQTDILVQVYRFTVQVSLQQTSRLRVFIQTSSDLHVFVFCQLTLIKPGVNVIRAVVWHHVDAALV